MKVKVKQLTGIISIIFVFIFFSQIKLFNTVAQSIVNPAAILASSGISMDTPTPIMGGSSVADTPTPLPTNTPIPTLRPTATPTPTLIPTNTPTPTRIPPTPTPTCTKKQHCR